MIFVVTVLRLCCSKAKDAAFLMRTEPAIAPKITGFEENLHFTKLDLMKTCNILEESRVTSFYSITKETLPTTQH